MNAGDRVYRSARTRTSDPGAERFVEQSSWIHIALERNFKFRVQPRMYVSICLCTTLYNFVRLSSGIQLGVNPEENTAMCDSYKTKSSAKQSLVYVLISADERHKKIGRVWKQGIQWPDAKKTVDDP